MLQRVQDKQPTVELLELFPQIRSGRRYGILAGGYGKADYRSFHA